MIIILKSVGSFHVKGTASLIRYMCPNLQYGFHAGWMHFSEDVAMDMVAEPDLLYAWISSVYPDNDHASERLLTGLIS